MIDFIIKLEDMLNLAGYSDWEIAYRPDLNGYILKLDEDTIFMSKYPVFMRDSKIEGEKKNAET